MISLVTLVGLLAAFCTTVSYVPQLKKVWQTRSTEDISLKMRPSSQSASQTDEPDDAKSISWVDDDATDRDRRMSDPVPEDFSITIPVTLRRRGVETKLIIEPPDGGLRLDPDPTLIKLMAQAHQWREDILAARFPTMRSLAKAYDKDERHIARLIPLAFLAPTIVEAIIAGSQPADLVAQDLITLRELPAAWNAQRAMLGFVLPQSPR